MPWEHHSVLNNPVSWGLAFLIGIAVLVWAMSTWKTADSELRDIRKAAEEKGVDVGGQGYWFELLVGVIVLASIAMGIWG